MKQQTNNGEAKTDSEFSTQITKKTKQQQKRETIPYAANIVTRHTRNISQYILYECSFKKQNLQKLFLPRATINRNN